MAKVAPDATIDGGLTYIDGSNYECLCSGEPSDYTNAYTTLMLARVALDAGDIVLADDANGRKATIAAKSTVSVTNPGTATHVALVDTGTTSLRYVTTCTPAAITTTVNIPAWKVNIQDPT